MRLEWTLQMKCIIFRHRCFHSYLIFSAHILKDTLPKQCSFTSNMNLSSSQNDSLHHVSGTALEKEPPHIKEQEQVHAKALPRTGLKRGMPVKNGPAKQQAITAASSSPQYFKALSQYDGLRSRVYWNADVALRGTGELRSKYRPRGGPLNVGVKAWDDLWEAQEHIETSRAIKNDSISSVLVKKAALQVFLDDFARLRAED
jgi:hypothetical protein